MSLLSKQLISRIIVSISLTFAMLPLSGCEYSFMPGGREVIRVYNDGDVEGWVGIQNNSKNTYGVVNGFMVRLINMKNPTKYVFLMPFQGASFNFKGEQFIGCEQANKPGVPFDWIRQYERGEFVFRPIDCSVAGVTVARCYPNGSPGGQGNRSPKLDLVNPEPKVVPGVGGGYEFGVFPTDQSPASGGAIPIADSSAQPVAGVETEQHRVSMSGNEGIERNVPQAGSAAAAAGQ
jgi:hypothetical protein